MLSYGYTERKTGKEREMEYGYLEEYYSTHDENGRLASRHGSVEFLVTMEYVRRCLFPGCRILEIGAGTGRYSHALARMGYRVDAVELIQHNVDVFQRLTEEGEDVTVRQGNALDLSFLEEEAYDLTLLLGPMYHLYTEADQRRALSEALRVTKRGGKLFAAYLGNDATVVQFCFGKGGLAEERYRALVDPDTFKCSSTPAELFQLYRREEIDRLNEGLPVRRLHYVGTDMFTCYMQEAVDGMDDGLFADYLRYVLAVCEREDLSGVSNHVLDILEKT